MKINTEGKDQIAGGIVYHAGEDGFVDIPDKIAADEGLVGEPADDGNGPTVVELKAQLKELGVTIPRGASKADMLALLAEAQK